MHGRMPWPKILAKRSTLSAKGLELSREVGNFRGYIGNGKCKGRDLHDLKKSGCSLRKQTSNTLTLANNTCRNGLVFTE